jgi:tetratricopeptide (TPR) repeat protein/SAM-dependent methyltransferase
MPTVDYRWDSAMADIEAAKKCFYEGLALLEARDYPNCEMRLREALAHVPDNMSVLSNLSVALLLQGKLTDAKSSAEKIVARDASNTGAFLVIAECLKKLGQFAELILIYDKIIALEPASADHWSDRGAALNRLARYQEALASCERAIALQPGLAAAHHNRANSLVKVGRFDDAVLSYDRALALNSMLDGAKVGRCNCLANLGRPGEAVAQLNDFIRLKPDNATAHAVLGAVHFAIGDRELAARHCRQSVTLDPRDDDAILQLGLICLAQGDDREALELAAKALDINETPQARELFVLAVRNARMTSEDARFRTRLQQALVERWDRPLYLMRPSLSLIQMNKAVSGAIERQTAAMPRYLPVAELCGGAGLAEITNDLLLRELMRLTPVCDIGFERMLTALRRELLGLASNKATAIVTENVLHFFCALTQQCFINEYIYAVSDDEQSRAAALAERLITVVAAGDDAPPLWVAAVGAYLPFHSVRGAASLLNRTWPAPVAAVLHQQIVEPAAQHDLRTSLRSLTTVENITSIDVKRQYEQNPYPRWAAVGSIVWPRPFDDVMKLKFPHAPYEPLGKRHIEVLVAGCGTGQNAIETSRSYVDADVLAIDLSATSLGYALYKTRELGLTNIHYAIADILKLDSLGRSFDLIESGGVLHHLANPFAGWRLLLSILRPGGVMRVGLYSELARQPIVRARNLIAERGYPATADGIRRCRQEIMVPSADPQLREATETTDFFSMSECRDLLFHVQEHRMTLPQLAAFMDAEQVIFLGFDGDSSLFKAYESRFPEDKAKTDLSSWHQFERERPRTFGAMYQFWIQKPPTPKRA